MSTLRALGRLLLYPDDRLGQAIPYIREALRDSDLAEHHRHSLEPLLERLQSSSPLHNQEHYVDQFDRYLSLHLFEYVHGQSRDRGKALLELNELYRKAGLAPATEELPDFLPLFCEALSLMPPKEAAAVLAEAAHVLQALAERLGAEGSDYGPVFMALASLSPRSPHPADVEEVLGALPKPLNSSAELDLRWREQPVRFMEAGEASP